jgi:hypothetical protein
MDLASGGTADIDANGDFVTAAPTFAVYYRSAADSGAYEIVARGYSGEHEQVLATQTDAPPWLSPPLAACAQHVAFVADGSLHVFEWKAK